MRDYMTIPEVAEQLHVSEKTIRRYIKREEMGAVLIGNTYRILPAEVEEFIESRRVRPVGRPRKKPAGEPVGVAQSSRSAAPA